MFAMLLNGAGGTGPTRYNRSDCVFVKKMTGHYSCRIRNGDAPT